MIRFSCRNCRATLTTENSMAGKPAECPICGKPYRVPGWTKGQKVVLATAGTMVVVILSVFGIQRLASRNEGLDRPDTSNFTPNHAPGPETESTTELPTSTRQATPPPPKSPWLPGTGYVSKPAHRPLQPHKVKPTTTDAVIKEGLGDQFLMEGRVEIRDNKMLVVYPGAKLTHAWKERPNLEMADYNGDKCILPLGTTVRVDEYGQFVPVKHVPTQAVASSSDEVAVPVSRTLMQEVSSWPKDVVCFTSKSDPITSLKGIEPNQVAMWGAELIRLVSKLYALAGNKDTQGIGMRVIGTGVKGKVFEEEGIRLFVTHEPFSKDIIQWGGIRIKFVEQSPSRGN